MIISTAEKHKLDPQLVACVILQESAGNEWASRFEPLFYSRYLAQKTKHELNGYIPSRISLVTEKNHRATSWGLMQVMGETARWLKFAREELTRLLVPEINLEYGCQYLAFCLKTRENDAHRALLKYNGGGNKNYPLEVLRRMEAQEFKKLLGD